MLGQLVTRLTSGLTRLHPVNGKGYVHVREVDSKPVVEFQSSEDCTGLKVNLEFFLFGGLKFLFMMNGRHGYEKNYCLYCDQTINMWKKKHSEEDTIHCNADELTMKTLMDRILPEFPRSILGPPPKGQKELPLWTFIPTENKIIPLLHILLGLGNNILDHFWNEWFDERVEKLSEVELLARNKTLLAEISCEDCENKVNVHIDSICELEDEKRDIESIILHEDLGMDTLNDLKETVKNVKENLKERKELLKIMKEKKQGLQKLFRNARDAERKLRKERGKADKEIRFLIESDVLPKYNVHPSKYHGGSMEGPEVRNLLIKGVEIFLNISDFVKEKLGEESSRDAVNVATDSEIDEVCEKYGNLCIILDACISFIYNTDDYFTDEQVGKLEQRLKVLLKKWVHMGLSITPKCHVLLDHITKQVKYIEGFKTMG